MRLDDMKEEQMEYPSHEYIRKVKNTLLDRVMSVAEKDYDYKTDCVVVAILTDALNHIGNMTPTES
jgi:hypothetical protein